MKKRTIRQKITTLVLGLVITTMALTIIVSAINLSYMMALLEENEIRLGMMEAQEFILAVEEIFQKQSMAIHKTITAYIVVIIGLLVLASIVSTWFSAKMTKPISYLTTEVMKIEGGNLEQRIEITTGDEVEELADAFNEMTVQLKTYMENLAIVTAEKERLRTELKLSASIQADMLPNPYEFMEGKAGFLLHATMNPARKVGGDFYDFFQLDEENIVFLIADVSGKSIPAAFFMVVAKTLLQSRIVTGETLAEAVTWVNAKLCEENKHGMFVTAWIALLNLRNGWLTYVNAGHNPPLLGNRQQGFRYLEADTEFVLAGMADTVYTQKELNVLPGDSIFLYTDGVTESNNERGDFYGEERLLQILNNHKMTYPEQLIETVWEDIQDFQGGAEQFDDITMLAIHYEGVEENRMMCGKKTNSYTGTADIKCMKEVQNFVESTLKKANICEEVMKIVLIVTDEIYSNICRHSGASKVRVEIVSDKDNVVLEFSDDGVEFNPLAYPAPNIDTPIEERKPGGLGIYLIRELTDDVFYERLNGENHFKVRKML